jgi:hypothetical protein
MDTRKIKIIAAILAIASTALLTAILIAALNTDNAKKPKFASADVSQLAAGQFLVSDTDALRYFVIRPVAGEIYVVAAPLEKNAIPMPEQYWWKPLIKCKDFGLVAGGTTIAPESRFACRDPGQPDEWASRWQWDVHGRHIPDSANAPVDDMYRVRFELDDDEIVFLSLEN